MREAALNLPENDFFTWRAALFDAGVEGMRIDRLGISLAPPCGQLTEGPVLPMFRRSPAFFERLRPRPPGMFDGSLQQFAAAQPNLQGGMMLGRSV